MSMSPRVCPVCQTFSSSSNNTLNAHIDQCLSAETKTQRETSSKATKHQIKPRRTRSMVDIYKAAECCTVEDLHRRNGGTIWASNSSLPAGNSMVDKKSVYIDSDGTKLRILSGLRDIPSSSKPCSGKLQRRKHLVQDDDLMNSGDLGCIKKWVVSKRSCRRTVSIQDQKREDCLAVVPRTRSDEGIVVSRKAMDSSCHEISGLPDANCGSYLHPSELLWRRLSPEKQLLLAESVDALEPHKSSYTDIAPILIPGPPGCYLPSPDHVTSEELQANSSLTTCSDNEHEAVDGMESIPMLPLPHVQASSYSFNGSHSSQHGGRKVEFFEYPTRRSAYQLLLNSETEPTAADTLASPQLPASGDSGALNQSAANSVLRLMGKNLMVMNEDSHLNISTMEHRNENDPVCCIKRAEQIPCAADHSPSVRSAAAYL